MFPPDDPAKKEPKTQEITVPNITRREGGKKEEKREKSRPFLH